MQLQRLDTATDVLAVLIGRLGENNYSHLDAELCFNAICDRKPHLLKQLNIEATSIYEKADIRVYRLERNFHRIFVQVQTCYSKPLVHWHEDAAALFH